MAIVSLPGKDGERVRLGRARLRLFERIHANPRCCRRPAGHDRDGETVLGACSTEITQRLRKRLCVRKTRDKAHPAAQPYRDSRSTK